MGKPAPSDRGRMGNGGLRCAGRGRQETLPMGGRSSDTRPRKPGFSSRRDSGRSGACRRRQRLWLPTDDWKCLGVGGGYTSALSRFRMRSLQGVFRAVFRTEESSQGGRLGHASATDQKQLAQLLYAAPPECLRRIPDLRFLKHVIRRPSYAYFFLPVLPVARISSIPCQ